MSNLEFTPNEIRDGLRYMAKDALAECSGSYRQLRDKTRQGLEKLFENAFLAQTPKDWTPLRQLRRSHLRDVGIPMRGDGFLDALLKYKERYRLGIEFKVVKLPRLDNTSPNTCMYDLGQLAYDYIGLENYQIDLGYCIVVIDGPLVEMSQATHSSVARLFHNAMFVDYHSFVGYGTLKKSGYTQRWKDATIEAVTKMGFDKPFDAKKTNGRFCYLDKKAGLAVIGIEVKIRQA